MGKAWLSGRMGADMITRFQIDDNYGNPRAEIVCLHGEYEDLLMNIEPKKSGEFEIGTCEWSNYTDGADFVVALREMADWIERQLVQT